MACLNSERNRETVHNSVLSRRNPLLNSAIPLLRKNLCFKIGFTGRCNVSLAKIESAPLVRHIADVQRLNLEISRSPDVAFELPEGHPSVANCCSSSMVGGVLFLKVYQLSQVNLRAISSTGAYDLIAHNPS